LPEAKRPAEKINSAHENFSSKRTPKEDTPKEGTPNSPLKNRKLEAPAVQVTATAFVVLFCIVGLALWGKS
jgi:hypothetical protein